MNLAVIGYDYGTPMSYSDESIDLRNKLNKILDESHKAESLGRTSEVSEVLNELNEVYREASIDNWDSEGSKAVSPGAYLEAQRIINDMLSVLPAHIPMPELSSVNSGGVLFEWCEERYSTFAFIIHENSRLNYSGIFNKSDIHNGSIILYDSLPKDITDKLQKLYTAPDY